MPVVRTALRVVVIGVATGLLLVLAGSVVLYAGGGLWLANRVLREVNPYPGTELKVRAVHGSFLTSVELHDLVLSGGPVPLRIDVVRLRYHLPSLLRHDIEVEELHLVGPAVSLGQLPDSSWNLLPPAGKTSSPASSPESPKRSVSVRAVSLSRGQVLVRFHGGAVLRIEGLEARAGDLRSGPQLALRVDTLGLRVLPPGPSPHWVSLSAAGSVQRGRLELSLLDLRSPFSHVSGRASTILPSGDSSWLRDAELHLTAQPLAFRDLAVFGSRFEREGSVALELRAGGSGSRVAVTLDSRFSDGGSLVLEGSFTPPGILPVRYDMDGHATRLDLGVLTGGTNRASSVNADFEVTLLGPSLDRMGGMVRADLTGLRHGSLGARRASLRARFVRGEASIRSWGNAAGVDFVTRGVVSPFDSIPSYSLSSRVRAFAAEDSSPWLGRLVGRAGANLFLEIDGRGLRPQDATVRMHAATVPGASGGGMLDSGRVEARLARGTVRVRGQVGLTGGLVGVEGTATLDPGIRYRIERGTIERVDLAALLGDSVPSAVNASFTLRGRGMTARSAEADGRIEGIRASFGHHEVTDTWADVRLSEGLVRLTSRANLDGSSLDLDVTAAPFAPSPILQVKRADFRHLDLARLFPTLGLSTDLAGNAILDARGRDWKTLKLSTRLSLKESRLADQPIEGGMLEGTLARGGLEFRTELRAPAGRIVLAGTARPFDDVPSLDLRDGSFQDVDLSRFLGRAQLQTRLAGWVTGQARGKALRSLELTAALQLDTSTVNQATIRTGRLRATLEDGKLRLLGRLLTDSDSLSLNAYVQPFIERPRFQLESDIYSPAVASLLGRADLDAGGAVRLEAEGELGSRQTTDLRARLFAQGHFAAVRMDSAKAVVKVANGTLRVDTLTLRANVGEASGSGDVTLAGRSGPAGSELRIDGRITDLSPLAPLLGLDRLELDSGGFVASLGGPAERRRITLLAQSEGLRVGAGRVGAVRASLGGELGAQYELINANGTVALERLWRSGQLIPYIRLQAAYDGLGLDLRGESQIDRERGARIFARWNPRSAQPSVRLDSMEVRSRDGPWGLLHPVEITYGDRISIGDFVLALGSRRIAIDGVVDRRGEQGLHARLDSVPLQPFTGLLPISDLEGEVTGRFDLIGPAEAPRASGAVATALQSRGKAVGLARGSLDWGPDGLRFDIGVIPPKGDSLKATGEVPLALSLAGGDSAAQLVRSIVGRELAVDMTSKAFPLAAIDPLLPSHLAQDLRGTLSLNVRARGSMADPCVTGAVGLRDGRIRLTQTGTTYDHAEVSAELDCQEVRLTKGRVESSGGELTLLGGVRFTGTKSLSYDLNTTLRDFQIASTKNLRSKLSGKLHLGGTSQAPIVTGALTTQHADFSLTGGGSEGSAADVTLTPADLRVLDQRFGYVPSGAGRKQNPHFEAAAIDLDVALGANTWVRRNNDPVVAVELGGKLKIRKEHGKPLGVFGAIKPLPGRSFVELFGRRFDLKGGTVDLEGPLETARLELHAEYRVTAQTSSSGSPDVVITAEVEADTGKIAVVLGSNPLMEHRDIVSYLMTGGPASTSPNLTGTAQPTALTTGTSVAVGAALGAVAGGAGQQLGLDVVQVLQDLQGTQTLVAGKYASPKLYLGFRQPLTQPTDRSGQENETNAMEFEVEYAAFRDLLVNLQGAGTEFRVFLRLRGGY